jgi:hypothetical protein
VKPFKITLALLLVTGFVLTSEARPWHPFLFEKVRVAEFIGVGEVISADDKLKVKIVETLKGSAPASSVLEMEWKKFDSIETRTSFFLAPGSRLLIFAVTKNGAYEPVAGPQGVIQLSNRQEDKKATQSLLQFEAATTSKEKESVLAMMLSSTNGVAQQAALPLIYLEGRQGKFDPKALREQVILLTRNSNPRTAGPATQALEIIATKHEIPALIDLMESPNRDVAQTAHQALTNRTGGKINFNSWDGPSARAKSVKQWRDWWEKNQDTVELRP